MNTAWDAPLRMPENIGVAEPLDKSQFDKLCAILLLPAISCESGAIHMAEEFCTESLGVFLFWRKFNKYRCGVPVDLCIEICALDVDETQLHPVRGLRVPDWWVPIFVAARLMTVLRASSGGASAK